MARHADLWPDQLNEDLQVEESKRRPSGVNGTTTKEIGTQEQGMLQRIAISKD